jgi:hypothetical protein
MVGRRPVWIPSTFTGLRWARGDDRSVTVVRLDQDRAVRSSRASGVGERADDVGTAHVQPLEGLVDQIFFRCGTERPEDGCSSIGVASTSK